MCFLVSWPPNLLPYQPEKQVLPRPLHRQLSPPTQLEACKPRCRLVTSTLHHPVCCVNFSLYIRANVLASASSNASASTMPCVSLSVLASIFCYRVIQGIYSVSSFLSLGLSSSLSGFSSASVLARASTSAWAFTSAIVSLSVLVSSSFTVSGKASILCLNLYFKHSFD